LLKVFNEAVSYAKDGASFPELDRLTRSRIAEGGYPGQPSHPICHALELAPTNRHTRIRPARERFEREWSWRLSRGFTGRAGGGLRLEDNFWITDAGNQNSARIQMIFGWRVPPARRDELVTTPARNVIRHQASIPSWSKAFSLRTREEIVAMACDVINIPSPTGEELQMAEYLRARSGSWA